MGRGTLTKRIQKIAINFLGRKITRIELRLYPYLDYLMKNEQRIDINKVNKEDREIFMNLKREGHMEGGARGLAMTREFYDYINDVLWWSYVAQEDEGDENDGR